MLTRISGGEWDTTGHGTHTHVVTWQAPTGPASRRPEINVSAEQEAWMRSVGTWPKAPDGTEFCQVSIGRHWGRPTWTLDELRTAYERDGRIVIDRDGRGLSPREG